MESILFRNLIQPVGFRAASRLSRFAGAWPHPDADRGSGCRDPSQSLRTVGMIPRFALVAGIVFVMVSDSLGVADPEFYRSVRPFGLWGTVARRVGPLPPLTGRFDRPLVRLCRDLCGGHNCHGCGSLLHLVSSPAARRLRRGSRCLEFEYPPKRW